LTGVINLGAIEQISQNYTQIKQIAAGNELSDSSLNVSIQSSLNMVDQNFSNDLKSIFAQNERTKSQRSGDITESRSKKETPKRPTKRKSDKKASTINTSQSAVARTPLNTT